MERKIISRAQTRYKIKRWMLQKVANFPHLMVSTWWYSDVYLLYLRLSLTKFVIQSRIKGYSINCILFSSLTWKLNFGLGVTKENFFGKRDKIVFCHQCNYSFGFDMNFLLTQNHRTKEGFKMLKNKNSFLASLHDIHFNIFYGFVTKK